MRNEDGRSVGRDSDRGRVIVEDVYDLDDSKTVKADGKDIRDSLITSEQISMLKKIAVDRLREIANIKIDILKSGSNTVNALRESDVLTANIPQ